MSEFEKKQIKLGDGGIEVVSQEESEKCTYVVCATLGTETPFTDNLIDECCMCGTALIIRPHAPKKPKRICIDCMMRQITKEE